MYRHRARNALEVESESRWMGEGGEGISIAFANMDLRPTESSPDNEVAERDFAMVEGRMVSKSVTMDCHEPCYLLHPQ
jgi:hypothetical protein